MVCIAPQNKNEEKRLGRMRLSQLWHDKVPCGHVTFEKCGNHFPYPLTFRDPLAQQELGRLVRVVVAVVLEQVVRLRREARTYFPVEIFE